MAPLQLEFFEASVAAEEARKQEVIKVESERKRQRNRLIGVLSTGLLLTTTAAGLAVYQWQSAERGRIEKAAKAAKSLLSVTPLKSLITAISLVGQSRSPFLSFPNQSFPPSVKDALFSAVQNSWEKNVFESHQSYVIFVAISTNGLRIVSGGENGTVRLWDIRFESWLKAACERLRDHPVLKTPDARDAREAKATCETFFR